MNPKDKKRYAQELLDFLPLKTSGNLLDVGCGKEEFLVKEGRKRGFRARGIDPLINTDLEHFKTEEKFDVLVLKHVLEHISDLDRFLNKCRDLLKSQGLILISCPNIKSLMYFIFRSRWYGLQPTQHVWQFTPELLKKVLEKNNFKILKSKINSLDYQVKGVKGIVFKILLAMAKILPVGDQLVVVAKKN
jgi:predicted SAM-dependent methyltransferase